VHLVGFIINIFASFGENVYRRQKFKKINKSEISKYLSVHDSSNSLMT